jgi:hypothetical protein
MSMTEHEMERVVGKAVEATMTKMGFDLSDPISIQEDIHFLRSLRHITGAAGTKAVMVLVGIATIAIGGGVLVAIGKAVKQAIVP